MYGETHATEFLLKLICPEAKKMKTMLQLPEDAPYFYAEDYAPGHYNENCSATNTTGMNDVRKQFFVDTNGHRKLTPKKGTPRFGVGDQMHGWIKDRIHKQLAKLGAMSENDLTKMPATNLMRRGGHFVSSKAYKRCLTMFLYCLVVAMVRADIKKYAVRCLGRVL